MFNIFKSLPLVLMIASLALLPAVPSHAQTGFDDPGGRGGVTGGDIVTVSDKVDAGNVALGSAAQVVVLLRNDDSKPLKISDLNLYPSSNVIASIGENKCSDAPISSGEICAISVQVKGLQQGSFRIEMLVRHEGRSKLLTTAINGSVVSSGNSSTDLVSDIEAIPASLEFGDLKESRSQVKAVILRNKTSESITIDTIEVEAGSQSGYVVNSNCGELRTGAACVASVTWTPSQSGPSTGTMIVRHSGATEISTIELTGTYQPYETASAKVFPDAVPGKGLLVSSQNEINYGAGIEQSSSITVSLVNTGDSSLTLTNIRMANSENGVRAEDRGCKRGMVLASFEACPLTLTWEPVREGAIVDDVQISHTGARGVLVMPIRGTATKAVNKDKKPIFIGEDSGADAIIRKIQPLSMSEMDMDDSILGDESSPSKKSKPSSKKSSQTMDGYSKDESVAGVQLMQDVDVRGKLDGYTISSFSKNRAIISGPGGSRVVFTGEQAVIGGVLWQVSMQANAVEFQNGKQKVLLLFDKSLSSLNFVDAQSAPEDTSSDTSSSVTTTP